MNNKIDSLYIYHKDWEGKCILDNNKIYRENLLEESGTYEIVNNKLLIKWDKWNEEDFYYYNDNSIYYFKNIFDNNYSTLYLVNKEDISIIILDKNNKKYILYNINNLDNKLLDKIIEDTYTLDNDLIISKSIIYKNIINNIYCNIEDFYNNVFFELNIINNSINEFYIFNRLNKTFYNSINIDNRGVYSIIENSIYMNWDNGYTKKFYSNKYTCYDKINKNINIIKPINIFIEDRVLFSNISLCKNKIILTSMHFKNNNWDYNLLNISISNANIINKTIISNDDDYESSTIILLEIDNYLNNLFIKIIYKDKYKFNIYLEQLNIIEHKICAMTLFKDDYLLLKRYLKYYSNLGIEIFYLYYNKKIDYLFVEEISKLNENNNVIYLVEWDYIYWWKEKDELNKYHHAQLMAINDSLYILKNYCEYLLYNDLDEYIDNNFINFNKLIDNNKSTDIFIFKNRFCKMGNDLIKYKDFDYKFNLNNIVQGNYYPEYREKNLIKLNSINVMGVHKYFKKFHKDLLNELIVSQFFHIVNFEEKNREYLMNDYVY
jgi:hypothetical protein